MRTRTWTGGRAPAGAALAGLSMLLAFGLACGGDKDGEKPEEGNGTRLEFNKGELFYKSPVTEAEATKLGEYLVEDGYFDGKVKSVQIVKDSGTYKLRLVVVKGSSEDPEYQKMVKLFGLQVSTRVFGGERLVVDLCDDRFETVSTIEPLTAKLIEIDGGTLYHAEDVDRADADRLGAYLKKVGIYDGTPKSVYLDKDGETWVVRVVTTEQMRNADGVEATYASFGLELSGMVFDGAKVRIELCDEFFGLQKTVDGLHGKRLEFNGGEIYFADGATEDETTRLGNLLIKEGFFDGTRKSLRLTKDGEDFVLQMVVLEGFDKDEAYARTMKGFAKAVSKKAFKKKKVHVHLCSPTWQTLRVVSSK